MKLLPRADVWRHPEGWAVTTYNPDNTRTDLPTRVFPSKAKAMSYSRDLVLMGLVEEVQVYGAVSRTRVQRVFSTEVVS